jgi:hypothetical protein
MPGLKSSGQWPVASGQPGEARGDKRKVALVTTTINVPRCLTAYL